MALRRHRRPGCTGSQRCLSVPTDAWHRRVLPVEARAAARRDLVRHRGTVADPGMLGKRGLSVAPPDRQIYPDPEQQNNINHPVIITGTGRTAHQASSSQVFNFLSDTRHRVQAGEEQQPGAQPGQAGRRVRSCRQDKISVAVVICYTALTRRKSSGSFRTSVSTQTRCSTSRDHRRPLRQQAFRVEGLTRRVTSAQDSPGQHWGHPPASSSHHARRAPLVRYSKVDSSIGASFLSQTPP